MNDAPDFDQLRTAAESVGLACRGGFHPEPADGVPPFAPGTAVGTVVLLGFVGGDQWPAFARSPEYADSRPDPLDRWSRRLIDALGKRVGARSLYPSEGPPWLPFQRWATRAEAVYFSPLGLLVHVDWGLWHSYRGALALRERLSMPSRDPRPNPCNQCAAKPCLRTCPVGAVAPRSFDHHACVQHVLSRAGSDCLRAGCRARRSCPVGESHRVELPQSEFHMRAFVRGMDGGEAG